MQPLNCASTETFRSPKRVALLLTSQRSISASWSMESWNQLPLAFQRFP